MASSVKEAPIVREKHQLQRYSILAIILAMTIGVAVLILLEPRAKLLWRKKAFIGRPIAVIDVSTDGRLVALGNDTVLKVLDSGTGELTKEIVDLNVGPMSDVLLFSSNSSSLLCGLLMEVKDSKFSIRNATKYKIGRAHV